MEPVVEKSSETISTQDSRSQAEKLFVRDNFNEQMPTFKETLTNFVNEQMPTFKEALANFGLLRKEINVYLHLAITGPKKAKEIGEAIAIHRTETYRLLHHLEKKGLVFSVLGNPVKFTAVPLDKAIDLLIEAQKIKIQILENQKAGLVESLPAKEKAKTMRRSPRSQLEMNVDILEVLAQGGPLKLTHIMSKAHVNCNLLRECLDFLIKQGLVEVKIIGRERKVYAITQLGVTVLEQFRELKEALPIIEETGNEARNQEPYLF
jgi:sugar-specific transcriptional regulator TrmB